MKRDYPKYRQGRERWVKKHGGAVIQFHPFEEIKRLDGPTLYRAGYQYTLSNERYEELSYYINCPKELVHLKTLIALDTFSSEQEQVKKIVESFQCRGQ